MTERRSDGTLYNQPHGSQIAAGVNPGDPPLVVSIKLKDYQDNWDALGKLLEPRTSRRDSETYRPSSIQQVHVPGERINTPPMQYRTAPPDDKVTLLEGFGDIAKLLTIPLIVGYVGFCWFSGSKADHPPAHPTQATSTQTTGVGTDKFNHPPAHPLQVVSQLNFTPSAKDSAVLASISDTENMVRSAPVSQNIEVVKAGLAFATCKPEIAGANEKKLDVVVKAYENAKAYKIDRNDPRERIGNALSHDYCKITLIF